MLKLKGYLPLKFNFSSIFKENFDQKFQTKNLFHQLSHSITQTSHFHFIQIGFSNSPRLTKYLQTSLLSHRPRIFFPIQRKNNGTLCVDVKNEGKKNYKSFHSFLTFFLFPYKKFCAIFCWCYIWLLLVHTTHNMVHKKKMTRKIMLCISPLYLCLEIYKCYYIPLLLCGKKHRETKRKKIVQAI